MMGKAINKFWEAALGDNSKLATLAKAVISEAEKNASPAQPVQEPVGMVKPSEEWGVAGVLIAGLPIGTKLYAAPVERQWVDLTDYEIGKAIGTLLPIRRELNDARAVIAAFKEKNNV